MKFAKRLRLYLTGVLIGLVFVVFFFNDRISVLTDWMPNKRVLVRLQQTEARYTDNATCLLECFSLDTADVRTIKKSGDVKFRLSDTHSEPLVYVVDGEIKGESYRLTFDATDSTSVLTRVARVNSVADCPCSDASTPD
ncbi:MAG: hypothetical protein ABR574_05735 [Cryomorphaceae bacterium]|nr:hypothetical protein [Flavobacteriales bacterium]